MIESRMQLSNQWGHFAHFARSILILCSEVLVFLPVLQLLTDGREDRWDSEHLQDLAG